MKRDHITCPNCGSGDVGFLLRQPTDDVFANVPAANRHCFVCGVRWEVDEIVLDERSA